MNMPLYAFDLSVAQPGRRPFHIWLPLFLLWPIVIVLLLPVFAVTIVLDVLLFLFGGRYHRYTLFVVGCLDLLGETRGLTVHVRDKDAAVDMTVL